MSLGVPGKSPLIKPNNPEVDSKKRAPGKLKRPGKTTGSRSPEDHHENHLSWKLKVDFFYLKQTFMTCGEKDSRV